MSILKDVEKFESPAYGMLPNNPQDFTGYDSDFVKDGVVKR